MSIGPNLSAVKVAQGGRRFVRPRAVFLNAGWCHQTRWMGAGGFLSEADSPKLAGSQRRNVRDRRTTSRRPEADLPNVSYDSDADEPDLGSSAVSFTVDGSTRVGGPSQQGTGDQIAPHLPLT